ncbi:MAG: GDSL-type esterase/lipase family protein [Thermodesulfobacteriota bacterium]|nr:GDSL-type esterase/lipase family protein [Thermodesulfobacteriota bacterium]
MKKAAILSLVIVLIILGYLLYPEKLEIRNAHPEGENIICFGDSLTYGTGASAGMDYPSQLAGLTGSRVINAGIPGDTTADALARLDKDVLSQSPRIVLITLGGNDLKNRVSSETAFNNLQIVIEKVQERGALVVVGGIDIPLFGRGFGKKYKRVCSKTGAILIPNIYEDIFGHEDLMTDPIHPNDKGYQIMAKRFYEAIRPYQ